MSPLAYVAIHRIADRLTPALRRQFIIAAAKLQHRISLAALVRAVERGELSIELTAAINTWPRDLQAAVRVMNQAFAAAAAVSARQLRDALKLDSSFTLVNPLTLEAADTRSALLVREITAETRRALQVTIREAIKNGQAPREAARVIKPMIGLTEKQALAVINERRRLLEQGVSSERVAAAGTRYANQLLRHRAQTIARTETIRASNDGQTELWRQARQRGLLPVTVKKRWLVTPDDRLCPRCRPLSGVEVPLDALFPGNVLGPPLHPACRCALSLARQAARGRRVA